MARPRADERRPLLRLQRAVERGEGVEDALQPHLTALCREAVIESEAIGFSVFEEAAGALALKLYGRVLASEDALTISRALGEVVRSLRALGLLGTAAKLRGRVREHKRGTRGLFSAPRATRPSDAEHGEEAAAPIPEDGADVDERTDSGPEAASDDDNRRASRGHD